MTIVEYEFGRLPDGRRVAGFTLENTRGIRAQIASYGGALVSLIAPDRSGRLDDIALGYDDVAGYATGTAYFGAVIGRYGNRIADARFTLGGFEYRLAANNGPNHLHGGLVGFDKILWSAAARTTADGAAVELSYESPDGDSGYPGQLSVRVTYTLTHDRALRIDYLATTDHTTVVNLTNHAYWNLAGHAAGSILDHRIELAAARFAAVRDGLIPTGELRAVAGTPLDFRTATALGARIDADDDQLRFARGYDHSFAIDGTPGELRRAARVWEPVTGRGLETFTTEPAVQLYTGNFLDGARGKAGAIYAPRSGFCLETQHHPDSPNQPAFPTTVLAPGETYRSTTIYRFVVE